MKTAAQSRQTTPQSSPTSSSRAIPSTSQSALSPLFRMQRTIGNQALAGLLASGRIQPKLTATSPTDSDQESGPNPRPAFRLPRTTVIQRKCACGGSCAKCAAEEKETRVPRLQLSPVSPRLQRAAKDAVAQPETKAVPESDRGPTVGLIVEDEASIGSPGQMKKSAFFAMLEADVCATADAELAAVGRSSDSCPYIRQWMAFYREQSAAHIERALFKYAPEATDANTARDYIVVVRHRVRRAIALWAKTGRVTGIPPEVGLMPSSREGRESTSKDEGFGMGLLRSVSTVGRAQFKERDGASTQPTHAESVRDQLGHGRPLESGTRSRMESAFGSDFSSVRVHDDSSAWGLSSHLNARAFTVGNNVAFGAGEYQPGTLAGDALIAHELAHVVQQGAASQSNAPMLKGDGDYDRLEADADLSAVGAVASLWAGAKGKLADIGRNATPRLKSGLRLQRCSNISVPDPAIGPIPDYDSFSEPNGAMKDSPGVFALIQNWEQLDRVYEDSDHGNPRAKRFILEVEQTYAATGVYVAEKQAQPDCLIPAYRELKGAIFEEGCEVNLSLPYLRRDKRGGLRLRQIIGDAYDKRARELHIRNELIINALNLLGVGMTMKGTLGKAGTALETRAVESSAVEKGTGKAIVGESSTAKAAKTEGTAAEETAGKPAKVEEAGKVAAGVAAESSALSKALAELRLVRSEVSTLSDAALSRVMAKGRVGTNVEAQIQAMKGQLLEEIGEADITKMITTEAGKKTFGIEGAKGTPELIPGHSIKLATEQFTDGVIGVKDAATKTIEGNAIIEAKAGAPSSAGLAKTSGKWTASTARDALGAIETDLAENAAMRQQFFKMHQKKLRTFQGGKFNTADTLKDIHVSDLEALLDSVEKVKSTAKELGITQVERGGQFSKDIERIYEEGGTKITLTDPVTGAVEDWTLKVSPQRTKMIGVLPADVAATEGTALKAKVEAAKPFKVEILPVKPTEPQLRAVAKALKKLIDQGL